MTLWHAWRGEERQALEALAASWNATHEATRLEATFVPYEALASRVETAVPMGNGPDLFIFAHERAGDWARRGIVRPVEALAEALPVAATALALPAGVPRAAGTEGAALGWPLAGKALALFRDRRKIPEAPRDTEALLAAARAHTHPAQGEWGLVTELASPYAVAPWLHGFGGGVLREGGVRFRQAGNVAALGFVRTLAREFVPLELSGAQLTQLFDGGKAAMAVSGPWLLGELRGAAAGGVDWAVSPLPRVTSTGSPAAPYATLETLFLARESDAARELGRWLAGPAGAEVRARVGRQIVAIEGTRYEDPALLAFSEQLARATPMPTDAAFALHWEPLARALRGLGRGSLTPEQALAQADTDLAILQRPAPRPADPRPWALAALALAAGSLALGTRAAWRARRDLARWSFAYAWIGPAFGASFLLVVLPFVTGALVSLFETDGTAWSFVGLAHFLDILLARDWPLTSHLSFWSTLGVTLLWTVANLALHVGLGVALALLLREPWVRLRGGFRALLVLPWAIPSYLTAMVWKGLFQREMGAINALLGALGLEPVGWFDSFATAFAANLTTNAWLGFPFMMVTTLGALQAVPRELEEAAALDGANGWQRFRHVILPQLLPALVPAIVLGSVWTFNAFNVIYLVSGGEPDGSTDILVSQAYRWAFSRGHRYGYAAAYAVLIFGVLAVYGRAMKGLLARSQA